MDPQRSDAEKMPAEREISHARNEGIDEPEALLSGLALHQELPKALEEERAERRFVLKIDLLILPLLIFTFFYASLVSRFLLWAKKITKYLTNKMSIGPW
jgi:hypothetical protein